MISIVNLTESRFLGDVDLSMLTKGLYGLGMLIEGWYSLSMLPEYLYGLA